ncbi:MAG TPA: FGGY-family carbohydrate kinase [Dehalococcoidia bacterium]|nr:FGGY-family carbohydrate kinase [Dehalococcoidia bacterium]
MSLDVALGIDLGTTALKVALVDDGGRVVAGIRRLLRAAEPAGWERALSVAVRGLLADTPPCTVVGIGLSGRGGSTCLIDHAGRALMPPGLSPQSPDETIIAALTGDAARLRPLAAHVAAALHDDPLLRRRLHAILAAKDALVYRLTGAAVTDPASGPDRLRWPAAALARCGVPAAALPEVRLPWDAAGALLPRPAARFGLPPGLPVAVGLHDGVAAQLGAGMVAPGDAALTLGTHAVLRIVADGCPAAATRFRFYSLWGERDPRCVVGGNARLGGAAPTWIAQLTTAAGERGLARLEADAAALPASAELPLFLPFLGGMYYPERHLELQGAVLGLQRGHGRGHLYRAALEGVAFALRHIEDELAAAGVQARRAVLTGAGALSPLWRSILSTTLTTPLYVAPTPEFTEAVGAARCAWIAAGRYRTPEEALAASTTPRRPLTARTDRWPTEERYAHYRAAVRGLHALLSANANPGLRAGSDTMSPRSQAGSHAAQEVEEISQDRDRDTQIV